jgi:hypothetical protein
MAALRCHLCYAGSHQPGSYNAYPFDFHKPFSLHNGIDTSDSQASFRLEANEYPHTNSETARPYGGNEATP